MENGAITHQTLLEILSRGEILPDIDIESEIEMIEADKLAGLDLALRAAFQAKRMKTSRLQTAIPVVSKTLKFAKKCCVD